jgi:uncharacterized heparinase superfamily protein
MEVWSTLRRYSMTVRHLRRRQLIWRAVHELRLRFYRHAGPFTAALFRKATDARVVVQSPQPPSSDNIDDWRQLAALWLEGRVRYLALEGSRDDWSALEKPKLWRYEHQYHRELLALALVSAADEDGDLLRAAVTFVENWSRECPPAAGDAWEPYPVARRILNWSLAAVVCPALAPHLAPALAQHIRFLRYHLEYHLSGNHLLCDLSALVAGAMVIDFEGMDELGELAAHRLEHELGEQLLGDGGYVERTVQYQSIVMQDLMVAAALAKLRGRPLSEALSSQITAMLGWLQSVQRTNGDYPWLNDAAPDATPKTSELIALGAGLGLVEKGGAGWLRQCLTGTTDSKPAAFDARDLSLAETGWNFFRDGAHEVLFDVGPLGPPEQPGHGHSDTLAYELIWDGKPLVLDTGVSTYDRGSIRDYERSTQAHATVTVNRSGPDELWAAFRVARRGRLLAFESRRDGGLRRATATIEAAAGWRQTRTLQFQPGLILLVSDAVDRVDDRAQLRSHIPLAPGWKTDGARLSGFDTELQLIVLRGAQPIVEEGWMSQGFGLRATRQVICVPLADGISAYAFVSKDTRLEVKGDLLRVIASGDTVELSLP